MTVRLHIERLLLTGLPVTAGEGATVRRIVGAELARLLADGGLATELTRGGALAELPAGALTMPRTTGPGPLAGTIARALYAALQPASRGGGDARDRRASVPQAHPRGRDHG
jgi:hypothetical protein